MKNMPKIIEVYNEKVTSKLQKKKAECLMGGNCQAIDIVYKCEVTRPLPKKK